MVDHLRSQVLRGTAISQPCAIFVKEIRPSEIGQLHGAICIQQNVLRLNVSMNNWWIHSVQILARGDYLPEILARYALGESAFTFQKGVDLSFGCKLQNKIKRLIVLVVVMKLNDVFMVKLVHDFDL